MNSTVLVALISFAGTVVGTAGGIMASSKLTAYRIEQLEKRIEAQAAIYSRVPVMEEKIKTINRRIAKLEHEKLNDYCSAN